MRITCPFCGERDHAEFAYLGDATPTRPTMGDRVAHDQALFVDYVYMRANPPGWLKEYWQHAGGCRSWLVVERNATSHEVGRVSAARDQRAETGSRP